MPKCEICGYESRSLQPHLKYKHNMTVKDYKDTYNKPVYDYNPGDNVNNWAKAHPEEHLKNCSKGGKIGAVKMNDFLKNNPSERKRIASLGGKAAGGKNLKRWRETADKETVRNALANAGHLSSISKGHEFMARVALRNNRFCKYPYKSSKYNIDKVFASRWEINFIKLCESFDFISSLVHEPFGIPYFTKDGKYHKYYPDFLVNNSIIVEIKPNGKVNDEDVVLKKSSAIEFCKENPQYRYVIITEVMLNQLRTGEITTSAQQELVKILEDIV